MEASFARRRIIEPPRLRALAQRSDVRGWAQTLSHFGAIVLTGAALWATLGSWLAVPVFMIHGMLIGFTYAAQHELSHGAVFKTK